MTLLQSLHKALASRRSLLERLEEESTDSYRLFHGVNEGRPGLSVDAYGVLTLAQVSSRYPLQDDELAQLKQFVGSQRPGPFVVTARTGPRLEVLFESLPGASTAQFWCREFGNEFAINLSKANRDPQLFLDFRAAKRILRKAVGERPDCSVLNLFAYTCSISCHCASIGAKTVWSVDFSSGNLKWGEKNFRRNRVLGGGCRFLAHDCLAVLWSMTGKEMAVTRKSGTNLKLERNLFDIVVVDPPAWSKGKFATVDLVRDPETVFAPAWQVVAPGGLLLAANNSAKVSKADFQARLSRMFAKAGPLHRCQEMKWVAPDADFPSRDGEHPLKVVFAQKGTTNNPFPEGGGGAA